MTDSFDPNAVSPEEYLEYLQSIYITPEELLRLNTRDYEDKEYIKIGSRILFGDRGDLAEKYWREIYSIPNDMPTKTQWGMEYNTIRKVWSDISQMAKSDGIESSEKVVIGTLNTGQVNAMAIKVPSGGQIIAINSGTLLFIFLMAKVVSFFIPYSKREDGNISFKFDIESITTALDDKNNIQGHERFLEALFTYLVLGNCGKAPQYWIEDLVKQNLAGILTTTSEMFIIAHEFSHIFLKHTANSEVEKKKLLADKVEVDVIKKNWEQEHLADAWGIWLTLNYHNVNHQFRASLSFLGIEMFFSLVEIIEQAMGIEGSVTHPPATARRNFLRELLKTRFPKVEFEEILSQADLMHALVLELWERNKAVFFALAQKFLEQSKEQPEKTDVTENDIDR